MAAIVMIFEMTLDYTVMVPMTLTVAISYGVRRSLIRDSIYTRKLTLRGEPVPETLRADIQFSRRAASIMHPMGPTEPDQAGLAANGYVTVREDAPLSEVIARLRGAGASVALVTDRDGQFADVKGAITQKDILDALADDITEMF
jgi:predicted transcriptional regulator